jgi:hypothetical protein
MEMTHEKSQKRAEQKRDMILAMFFSDSDDDSTRFLALVDHCGIDLTACDGDVKQIPNVIAAHYRLAQGRYDIDRAAHDLLTYPPVAARIKELEAEKRRARKH